MPTLALPVALARGLFAAQEALQQPLAPTTDVVSKTIVGVILVAVFALLALEAAHRVLVVLAAVAALWLITYFTPYHLMTFEATAGALDMNVLVLLAAMMAVVGVLKTTGVFEWAVARLLRRARGQPLLIMTLVAWFTAVASAFLDNVTTVIFVTPMVMGIARRLKIRAEALLLPMVMASNIGGTATLIGDPPNIMIGSGAHLSFNDFLEDLTVPCIIMIFWLLFYSRRYFGEEYARSGDGAEKTGDVPIPQLTNPLLARWMAVICFFILLGFLTHSATGMEPAVPALIGAAAALVVQDRVYLRKHRPSAGERIHGILLVTERDIEWPTLSFFGFLFIIVGAAVHTGLISTVAHGLEHAITAGGDAMGLSAQGTLLFAAILICWVSGICSAIIDNIPFVAVSIPIIAQLAGTLQGDPMALWWGLSLGACLGGNGSLIGASANVTTVGLAEREGVRVTFAAFTRFGATVAAGTLVIASLYLTAFVHLGKGGSLIAALVAAAVVVLLQRVRARPPRVAPA